MKKWLNRILIYTAISLLSGIFYGCKPGLKYTQKAKSSFAIVVDPLTLQNTEEALLAYQAMLEDEGLEVYVISDNWDGPESIREALFSYYNNEPVLEGAVFIGDVPIPHIMNAQHLATAYKRDQKRYPLHIAAIPSDRYYDDFDLQFDFIEKDSVRLNNYYYSLSVESPQYVKSDIYSGRIKPSILPGEDKYQLIAEYLEKVVSLRNSTEIDFLMSFTGHGYNSESLTSWAGEKLALREQFPELYTPSGKVEFLDFSMNEFMKPYLLGRMQDPNLDIALLHEHGSDDMQLINGAPDVSSVQESIDNVRRYLRSKLRSAHARGKDLKETKKYYMSWLGVPEDWFDDTFDKEVMDQDSIYEYNLDIYAQDAHEISPEAKFIMFDACFNGSFQEEIYLAGEYVFGKGSTMVAHGNTVNALQDKWPDEMLGLLMDGVRVGNWARQINTIETHLIGDPTYYFKSRQSIDYNKVIAAADKNPGTWNTILNTGDEDLQCLAISNLYDHEDKAFSTQLRDLYYSSPSFVVRMEILKQLQKYNDENYLEILKVAIEDPYELIRRTAATMIGECGHTELIEPLLKVFFDDSYSKRVKSNALNSFNFMDPDLVIQALPLISQQYSYLLNSSTLRDDLLKKAMANKKKINESVEYVASDSSVMKYRLLEIRTLRNYTYHFVVEEYIRLFKDPGFSDELRVPLIEAFAWFTHSQYHQKILDLCYEILENEDYSEEIRSEAARTINRLEVYN